MKLVMFCNDILNWYDDFYISQLIMCMCVCSTEYTNVWIKMEYSMYAVKDRLELLSIY